MSFFLLNCIQLRRNTLNLIQKQLKSLHILAHPVAHLDNICLHCMFVSFEGLGCPKPILRGFLRVRVEVNG